MAVEQTKRTELAGDPYGGALSKKLAVLGAGATTLVTLIQTEKVEPLPGAIILAGLAAVYMVVQGVVDVFKEINRKHATDVTTTLERLPTHTEPLPPRST